MNGTISREIQHDLVFAGRHRQPLKEPVEVVDPPGVVAVHVDGGFFRRDEHTKRGTILVRGIVRVRIKRRRPPRIWSEEGVVEVAADEHNGGPPAAPLRERRCWPQDRQRGETDQDDGEASFSIHESPSWQAWASWSSDKCADNASSMNPAT